MRDDSLYVFDKPIEKLTLHDVVSFVKMNPLESLHLEYKSFGLDDNKLTKSVSSFANSDGGNLFIGIKTPGDGNDSIEPIIELTSDQKYSKDRIVQRITDGIHPHIHGIRVFQIYNEDRTKWLCLVHIPPTFGEPHMASDRKYYHRIESTSKPMEHYHVQRAFNSILYPSLEPIVNIENGETVSTLSFKLNNPSPKTCKLPFLSVSFYNCTMYNRGNNTNVFFYKNGFRYSPRNDVIYGHSLIDVHDCSVKHNGPFFIIITVAGENFDSKKLCGYVDRKLTKNNYTKKLDLYEDLHSFWSIHSSMMPDELKNSFLDTMIDPYVQKNLALDDESKNKMREVVASILDAGDIPNNK